MRAPFTRTQEIFAPASSAVHEAALSNEWARGAHGKRVTLVNSIPAVIAMVLALVVARNTSAAPGVVPLQCSRGPKGQVLRASMVVPNAARTGSKFTVRVEGKPSGLISHFGLNYIHQMTTDLLIPAGTRYVAGSGRVVPNTGTLNARSGARVFKDARGIHLVLPAHIANDSAYTPPSFEFDLFVDAPAGAVVDIPLMKFSLKPNVFLLGDLEVLCAPAPTPFTMASVPVTEATP